MSVKALTTQSAVLSVPVGNEMTNDGIINAFDLESMVLLGMTYGAWFKLVCLVSVILVIVVNLQTIRRNWIGDSRKSPKKIKKRWTFRK